MFIHDSIAWILRKKKVLMDAHHRSFVDLDKRFSLSVIAIFIDFRC